MTEASHETPHIPIHLDTDEHTELLERIGKAIGEVATMEAGLDPGEPLLTAKNMKEILGIMGCNHSHYPSEALDSIADLHVRPIVEQLYADCPELVGLPSAVHVMWRVKHAKSSDCMVLGTCRAVSKKEREIAKLEGRTVYGWELTLALDVWMLLSPEQRRRLVHHELMHCDIRKNKPATRRHEIEDFGATMARFGLMDSQARPVALAMCHPETQQAVKTWVAGPDDAPLLGQWVMN